jgi:hypothetical protein
MLEKTKQNKPKQRGSLLVDAIIGAVILGIGGCIFVSITTSTAKPLTFATTTLTRINAANRLAQTLADQRFEGQNSGIVYLSETGISFQPVPNTEEMRYVAVSEDLDDRTVLVIAGVYPNQGNTATNMGVVIRSTGTYQK